MPHLAPLLRPRLLRILTRALGEGHVCIDAPAGYGKTTLLRALQAQRPHTYYIALTPADADLDYLQSRLSTLTAPKNQTLLLDDIQHIADVDTIRQWLHQQLTTGKNRFVLSGRQIRLQPTSAPILWIDQDVLAFSEQESLAWFANPSWHRVTGGWPLALALARQLSVSASNFDPAVTRQRLFDHLTHTLFADLSAELVHFMQIVAVPHRFHQTLATKLTEKAALSSPPAKLIETLLRRNLFLETIEDAPGWYRFHELIRQYLLHDTALDTTPLFAQCVAWFDEQGDREMAIEHALSGKLYEAAASRLHDLPNEFFWNRGRYNTMRRWILGLPATTQANYPMLLLRLGRDLHSIGLHDEGWQHIGAGIAYAHARQDGETESYGKILVAAAHNRESDFEQAVVLCRALLAEPVLSLPLRAQTQLILGNAYAGLSRLHDARRLYEGLLTDPVVLQSPIGIASIQGNLVTTILTPLGDFGRAYQLLTSLDTFYATRPGFSDGHALPWLAYYEAQGDWGQVRQVLEKFDQAATQVETATTQEPFWITYWRALLAIGTGNFDQAEQLLATIMGQEQGTQEKLCAAIAQSWLLRRQGRLDNAIQVVSQMSSTLMTDPLYSALLTLEAFSAFLCANRLSAFGDFDFPQSHCNALIALRARPALVRLHALLAIHYWRLSQPRWQRHANSVLKTLLRPGYEHLLTFRDPEVGAHFWTLCLVEDIATERALYALRQIGSIEPLSALLRSITPGDPVPALQTCRAIQGMARIGNEAAIPVLLAAQAQIEDKRIQATIEGALRLLEQQPPPRLDVKLLGEFTVWRDGKAIAEEEWPRPIVKKLFQYFVLHRQETLARDRILDDLWHIEDPQAAAVTFRTVHSRLRNVLEPFLRSKAPSRYFNVERDVYTFDPHQCVHVDAEQFVQTVRKVIIQNEPQDMPSLPDNFVEALQNWQPLLPALPYEEWLITPREELKALYVEGCLYTANTHLIRNELQSAIDWAQRSLKQAPWLEEAYQILMRCYARLDERSLALKSYADALLALDREFSAPPSPLTQWLAERLHRGEEI